MDSRSIELLELPAVLERLAATAASERGKELCLALEPSPHPAEVSRRQALTDEAVALLDQAADPDLAGIGYVRSAAELAAAIDPGLASLAAVIAGVVEADGPDLRDGASPALHRLRRELRGARARIADRLRSLARDAGLREHLQDDFVTERAGRSVLALRAMARGSVPGIVHDTSGSGQTLFVEPFAVVEGANRLREAESAERGEGRTPPASALRAGR